MNRAECEGLDDAVKLKNKTQLRRNRNVKIITGKQLRVINERKQQKSVIFLSNVKILNILNIRNQISFYFLSRFVNLARRVIKK